MHSRAVMAARAFLRNSMVFESSREKALKVIIVVEARICWTWAGLYVSSFWQLKLCLLEVGAGKFRIQRLTRFFFGFVAPRGDQELISLNTCWFGISHYTSLLPREFSCSSHRGIASLSWETRRPGPEGKLSRRLIRKRKLCFRRQWFCRAG